MEVIKISIFLLSGFYAFYKISPATNSDEHVSIPVVFVLNKKKIKKIKQKCAEQSLKVSFTQVFRAISVQMYVDIISKRKIYFCLTIYP